MMTLAEMSIEQLEQVVSALKITVPRLIAGKRATKAQAMTAIALSNATPAQIRAALATTPAAVSGQVDAIVDAAIRGVESRIAGALDTLHAEVAAIKSTPAASVDANTIAAAVNSAVSIAFKPISDAFTAAPAQIQERVAAAFPRQRASIAQIFGVPIAGDCEVWGPTGVIDPDYVFDPRILPLALAAIEGGDNVWLWGERGTGKTQLVLQIAARTGRQAFRVSCDRTMERSEFVGDDGLENGATIWKDGLILQAFRTPGALCLIDEASMLRPELAAPLHTMLEPGAVYTVNRTGERVQRAIGMAFIAADNTNGCGDETGRYAGAQVQNSALVDRFAYTFRLNYLPEAQEIRLLVARGADQRTAEKLVNLLRVCRAQVGGALIEPPSLRQAFAFCKAVKIVTAAEAWEFAVINKSPAESHEALRQLFTGHWPQGE